MKGKRVCDTASTPSKAVHSPVDKPHTPAATDVIARPIYGSPADCFGPAAGTYPCSPHKIVS